MSTFRYRPQSSQRSLPSSNLNFINMPRLWQQRFGAFLNAKPHVVSSLPKNLIPSVSDACILLFTMHLLYVKAGVLSSMGVVGTNAEAYDQQPGDAVTPSGDESIESNGIGGPDVDGGLSTRKWRAQSAGSSSVSVIGAGDETLVRHTWLVISNLTSPYVNVECRY